MWISRDPYPPAPIQDSLQGEVISQCFCSAHSSPVISCAQRKPLGRLADAWSRKPSVGMGLLTTEGHGQLTNRVCDD